MREILSRLPRGRRAILGAAALALCIACPCDAPALAQPTTAPEAPAAAQGSANPDISIEDLWVRGEEAYEAGDLDGALQAFEQALGRDRRRGRSWNYVGGVYFSRGDLPRALEHFLRAVEIDPRDVRVLNNLGTVYERLGEFARAEESYLRASLLDPAYPATQRNLGVLYSRRLGRPDAARRAWLRSLDLEPAGPDAAEVRRELEALPPEPALLPAP
jgi:tetratricopeptide (TPR) repeat protein